MTGYCEPSSLGARLLSGAKEVGIFGVEHQVNAEIGEIRSMSAHGDYEDLCQWLACQDPREVKKLFLVHGEPEVQQEFKKRLLKKRFSGRGDTYKTFRNRPGINRPCFLSARANYGPIG